MRFQSQSRTFSDCSFIVQISGLMLCGKFDCCCCLFDLGSVLGLLISIVMKPPITDITPKAVWGTNCPKIDVAPIKGAHSSQILAHTIVEKAHMRFLSADTNSVVQVVRMARVLEMAIFVPIAVCE